MYCKIVSSSTSSFVTCLVYKKCHFVNTDTLLNKKSYLVTSLVY